MKENSKNLLTANLLKKKKRTSKSFPNRKEMIKEGILEPWKEERTQLAKMCKCNRPFSLLQFSILCLMFKAKTFAMADVVVNVFKGIFKKIMLYMRENKGH